MNEEEIKKALEIIKQPITVNCIDYHYFDQDNYDNLVRIYDNCLWFIRNFEQLIDNCNELQQENARLKDKIKDIEKILNADCCVENIYQAMCQYLNIHDFELDLEDYLKEN